MARYIAGFLSKGYMNMPVPEEAELDAGWKKIQPGTHRYETTDKDILR